MVNFDLFFNKYNTVLIQSNSYVTKRQSIKLLGEILLDRANYNVMMIYVDQGDHLKICMNLLRDDRKMVQYEGFHVFKVRVSFQKCLIHRHRQTKGPCTGLCRQSQQIHGCTEDTDQQPRETGQVPTDISR